MCVVSFSGNSADSILSTNMWGIYADNGRGIAFEFDYDEIYNRANGNNFKLLVERLYEIDNENYQNSLLSEDEKNHEKLKKKIAYCSTPIGKNGLQYLISHFICLKNADSSIANKPLEEQIKFFQHLRCFNNSKEINLDLLENKFLSKVVYATDNAILRESFESFLWQNIALPSYNIFTFNKIIAKFWTTKSNIWQHEQEYRLLTPYYSHRDWLEKYIGSPINEKIEKLEELRQKNISISSAIIG